LLATLTLVPAVIAPAATTTTVVTAHAAIAWPTRPNDD
jgi:hypothetical protein